MTTFKLPIFILTSIFSIIVGCFICNPLTCVHWVLEYSYWVIFLNFSLFLYFLYKNLNPWLAKNKHYCSRNFWLKKRVLLIVLILATSFGFLRLHEDTGFKTVMDEPVITATAQGMHLARQVIVPTRAHHISNAFLIGGGFVDKRPPFFAFLTSILHDATGYRMENAFAVNFFLTGLFIFLAFIIGVKLAGQSGGIISVLLFLTLPLISQMANGAGLEILNLCMILIAMLAATSYLKTPNKNTLSLLCLSAVLLTYTRYESSIYIIPVGLIIILGWWRKQKLVISWPFIATPLLLVPYLWQLQVFKLTNKSWELESVDGAITPFSFEYLYDNIGHAVKFLFNTSKQIPNSPLLSTLGLICCVFFVVYILKCFREKIKIPIPLQVFAIFSMGFLLHLLMLLTYFFGQLDNPIIWRLSLPLHIPLVLCSIWILYGLHTNPLARKALLGLTLIFLATYTLPSTTQHLYSKRQASSTEMHATLNFIDRNKEHHPDLVISVYPWMWILRGIDATTFPADDEALRKLEFYLNSRPKKPKVYLHESLRLHPEDLTIKPQFGKSPSQKIKTKPLFEEYISETIIFRLNEITDIEIKNRLPKYPELKEGQKLTDAMYLEYLTQNLP